jgi:hypothetical protein
MTDEAAQQEEVEERDTFIDNSMSAKGADASPEEEPESPEGDEDRESEADSPPAADADGEETEARSDDDSDEDEQAEKARLAYEKRQARRNAEKHAEADDKLLADRKTLKDFDYDEDAYEEYRDERAKALARAELRNESRQAEEEQKFSEWQIREAEAAKGYDDYFDVAHNPKLQVDKTMGEIILAQDNGTDVLYHLGKNPEKAARIAQMPEWQKGIELTKIANGIKSAKAKASSGKKASKAPPPAKGIEGKDAGIKSVSATDPESDKLSDAEWLKRRERQLSKRR